jgi:hypothetical protein
MGIIYVKRDPEQSLYSPIGLFIVFVFAIVSLLPGFIIAAVIPIKTNTLKTTYILETVNINNETYNAILNPLEYSGYYVFMYSNNGGSDTVKPKLNDVQIIYSNNTYVEKYVEYKTKHIFNLFSIKNPNPPRYILSLPKHMLYVNTN